jgi:hypothetical protein
VHTFRSGKFAQILNAEETWALHHLSHSWEKQVRSARGVQAATKALRIRHINGAGVREKRPRGFKKEGLEPPISFSLLSHQTARHAI